MFFIALCGAGAENNDPDVAMYRYSMTHAAMLQIRKRLRKRRRVPRRRDVDSTDFRFSSQAIEKQQKIRSSFQNLGLTLAPGISRLDRRKLYWLEARLSQMNIIYPLPVD